MSGVEATAEQVAQHTTADLRAFANCHDLTEHNRSLVIAELERRGAAVTAYRRGQHVEVHTGPAMCTPPTGRTAHATWRRLRNRRQALMSVLPIADTTAAHTASNTTNSLPSRSQTVREGRGHTRQAVNS